MYMYLWMTDRCRSLIRSEHFRQEWKSEYLDNTNWTDVLFSHWVIFNIKCKAYLVANGVFILLDYGLILGKGYLEYSFWVIHTSLLVTVEVLYLACLHSLASMDAWEYIIILFHNCMLYYSKYCIFVYRIMPMFSLVVYIISLLN